MHHIYIQLHSNSQALQKEREELELWCKNNSITNYTWIEDDLAGKIHRDRIQNLIKSIRPGDTVVATDIASLGHSLPTLLQVMGHLHANHCTLITLNDLRAETSAHQPASSTHATTATTLHPNRTMTLFVNHLREIVEIESRMKASRSLDVVHTKREEGVTLGRPKGAKRAASKTVLHGKTDRLVELYQAGQTLAEIAAELGVSRGTVSNYLKAEGLFHPYRK